MPRAPKKVLFKDSQQVEPAGPQPGPLAPTLTAIPFHALLMVYGLFAHGITAHVRELLFKGHATLCALLVPYGWALVTGQTQYRKKRPLLVQAVVLVGGWMVLAHLAVLPVWAMVVVLGAPATTHVPETFALALHVLMLVVFPLLCVYQLDAGAWRNVWASKPGVAAVAAHPAVVTAIGGVVGTWLGVFPIPLDWDRPWQAWPITLVAGAYVGVFVGGAVAYLASFV